jgi:hypothetical protein
MRTRNKWLLAGLALAGVAAIGAAAARVPPIGRDYDIAYFSDAAKTNRVGGERWTCDGRHLSWGVQDGYTTTSSLPCNLD